MIKLIDFYSGSAPVDFFQVRADGYDGVILKGGQGGWRDLPPSWWVDAKKAGLNRGLYWVVDSRYRITSHLNTIDAVTNRDFGELGLWADCEKPRISMTDQEYWMTPYAGYRHIYDFMYGIQQWGASRFNKGLPGVYTSPGFWKLLGKIPLESQEWFAQAPLWTAQYPRVYIPGVSKPSLYGRWSTWTLWQYREGPDVNIFNGTDEEYRRFFGLDGVPSDRLFHQSITLSNGQTVQMESAQ